MIMKELTVTSESFSHNGMIPARYTCDGADISPHLKWSGAPLSVQSYVVICDDPDAPAGNWDHWILFNIPPGVTELPEQFTIAEKTSPGIMAGTNDFGTLDYGGPAPPSGVHRYIFKVYALDRTLPLREGVRKKELLGAMEGHILAKGEIMGRYTRKR